MKIVSPIPESTLKQLKAGDEVFISGIIYVGRDAAHKRLIEALDKGEKPPFEIKGQTIYYMGPSPAPPGKPIGAAGPTTSTRMDIYTPRMLAAGLKAMIGKGNRSATVVDAIKKYGAVYLVTTGGAAALLANSIKKSEVVAFEDLGPEAILKLTVDNFPTLVANDMYGGDLFEQGKMKYRREL